MQPDAPLRLRRHRSPSTSCSTIRRAPAAPAAVWALHKITHPELLVPDPKRSIRGGCFRQRSIQIQSRYLGRSYHVQPLEGAEVLARYALGETCRNRVRHAILYGLDGQKLAVTLPRMRKSNARDSEGHEVGFGGIARRIERHYRRYRQRGEASSGWRRGSTR